MGIRVEKPVIDGRVTTLVRNFAHYVEAFDQLPVFSDAQLKAHLETLRQRGSFPDVQASVTNRRFTRQLYLTLCAWGMNKRGSKAVSPAEFEQSLLASSNKFADLGNQTLETLSEPTATGDLLWQLIDGLRIVENNNRLVFGTKCLHHLLPNLVPPMDREYTQTFFGWQNPEFQYGPQACFMYAFQTFASIAHVVRPTQYVGDRWRTSGPKIIDNAVVAFCREHGLESTNRKYQRTRISQVRVRTSAPLVPMEGVRTLDTLGSRGKRKTFKFTGSINTGVVLQQSGKPCIDAEFFRYALQHFGGKIVYGGFKQDGPPRESFGEWVQDHSKQLNSRKLTARHGSFMAAILCDEAGVRSSLESNRRIILEFPS